MRTEISPRSSGAGRLFPAAILRVSSAIFLIFAFALSACTEFSPKTLGDVLEDTFVQKPCNSHGDCTGLGGATCIDWSCNTVQGLCVSSVREGSCYVEGVCYGNLSSPETPERNKCLVCYPDKSNQALEEVACAAGTACNPETGVCDALPDEDAGGICAGDACGEDPCGRLGCCANDNDCTPVPGNCSVIGCSAEKCNESSVSGDCRRPVNSYNNCANAVALSSKSEIWSVEQPEEVVAWTLSEDGHATFTHPNTPLGGQTAAIYGPLFNLSPSCTTSELIVQVVHTGELANSRPYLRGRAFGSYDWFDFGSLPVHAEPVPKITTFPIPDKLLEQISKNSENQKKFQLSLMSELSSVPKEGSVEVHEVRVATAAAPDWNTTPTSLIAKTGQETTWFGFAESASDDLIYQIQHKPDYAVVEYPALDEEMNQGIRIRLNPVLSSLRNDTAPALLVVDVRDGPEEESRISRIFVQITVESASICGNFTLDPDEECDLGEEPPAPLCSASCVSDILVAGDDATETSQPDLALFPEASGADPSSSSTSGRVAVVWEQLSPAGDTDAFLRVVDTRPAAGASVFLNEPRRVHDDDALAQRAPSVAVINSTNIAVAWEQDGGDADAHGVFFRLFKGDGGVITNSVPLKPYSSQEADTTYGQPRLVRGGNDGAGIAFAWVKGASFSGVDYSEIMMNRVFLADLEAPPDPITLLVAGATNREATSPVLIHLETSDRIVCAWHEDHFAAEGGSSKRWIRFAIVDLLQAGDASGKSLNISLSASLVDGEAGALGRPSLAPLADGGFLVAWEHQEESAATARIRWRRFDSSGATIKTSAYVASQNPGSQRIPALGVTAQEEVFLLWLADKGSDDGEFVGRLGSIGEGLGSSEIGDALFVETVVGSGIKGTGSFPVVRGMRGVLSGGNDDGRFAMAWQRSSTDANVPQVVLRFARLQGDESP